MHLFYGHNAGRFCARCHLPLTDAASQEYGTGPICRKLDNALLARMIPSDISKALECYKAVDPLTLAPDTLLTFNSLEAALLDTNAGIREDWRKEVKRVEWALSYPQNPQNIHQLHSLVKSLGYIGLVNLWNGEAATGLATITFEADRLFLSAPQNKAARIALKHITGWKFHLAQTSEARPRWSVPCEQSAAFFHVVIGHYPNHDGLSASIKAAELRAAERAAEKLAKEMADKAAAEAALALLPKPVTPAPVLAPVAPATPALDPKVQVTVSADGSTFTVATPYNVCYIATLKTLPPAARKWNKAQKVWEITSNYRAAVDEMLARFFPKLA